ncbi:hypothetical protein BDN72DRAFT_818756 [Pluteus cervinus]|uniref:Uncharacterized protein n=1 Tax=Pluteus cervinus TaxID=181527 RepID=A0ACD3AXK3_9AGAR|nr:hypothetical protein BDN72DRAFT_818756 [Pluteus cervinus]
MSRTMTKAAFYAVKQGHTTGIFRTWAECELQTKGHPNAKYKKFDNAADAEAFVAGSTVAAPASTSNKSSAGAAEQSTSISMPSKFQTSAAGKKRGRSPDVDEDGWDVVYSDGACKGNGKPGSVAGVGVWWGHDDPRNIAERCPGDQTNNRAELIAIVRVLETTPPSKTRLLIKTDSQYSINCFKEWLPKWRLNGFRSSTGPVKNLGIIKYLSALLDKRKESGQMVRLQYVKGHSGHEGNDGADYQANLGTRLPQVNELNWKSKLASLLAEETAPPTTTTAAPLEVSDDESEDPVPDPSRSPQKIRRIHSPIKGLDDSQDNAPPRTTPRQGTQDFSETQYEEYSYDSDMFEFSNRLEQELVKKAPSSSSSPSKPSTPLILTDHSQPAYVSSFISTSRPVEHSQQGGDAFVSTKRTGTPQRNAMEFTSVSPQKRSFSSVSTPIRRQSQTAEGSAFISVSVRPTQDQATSTSLAPREDQESSVEAKASTPKLSEEELEAYADCLLDDADYDLGNESDEY